MYIQYFDLDDLLKNYYERHNITVPTNTNNIEINQINSSNRSFSENNTLGQSNFSSNNYNTFNRSVREINLNHYTHNQSQVLTKNKVNSKFYTDKNNNHESTLSNNPNQNHSQSVFIEPILPNRERQNSSSRLTTSNTSESDDNHVDQVFYDQETLSRSISKEILEKNSAKNKDFCDFRCSEVSSSHLNPNFGSFKNQNLQKRSHSVSNTKFNSSLISTSNFPNFTNLSSLSKQRIRKASNKNNNRSLSTDLVASGSYNCTNTHDFTSSLKKFKSKSISKSKTSPQNYHLLTYNHKGPDNAFANNEGHYSSISSIECNEIINLEGEGFDYWFVWGLGFIWVQI